MQPINVYLSWLVPAILGRTQDSDALMVQFPGEIESVAAALRHISRQPLRKLYRGLLLEPSEISAGDVIFSRPGMEQSVSFSESRDVACYFALPDTIMSSYVRQIRPDVEGYIVEHTPVRSEILWHYSWNPIVYKRMRIDVRTAARMHPAAAHDPAQFDFVFNTQKEVTLKPTQVPLHVTPVGDTCPDADALDKRFTPPHILTSF